MAWFAVYEIATGRLESIGTVVADDAALTRRGLAKRELAFDPRVPTKRWNSNRAEFDDVAPAPPEPSFEEDVVARLARIEAAVTPTVR